jgi:hypothetical protein
VNWKDLEGNCLYLTGGNDKNSKIKTKLSLVFLSVGPICDNVGLCILQCRIVGEYIQIVNGLWEVTNALHKDILWPAPHSNTGPAEYESLALPLSTAH